MQRLFRGCRVSGRLDFGARGRVGVADPLQVMQAVQAEIGLWVQASVGHDSGDHVEVEGVMGQVQFEEALGLVGGFVSGRDCGLSGRQIALNPGPLQLPARNASGPRFNAVVAGPCWKRGGTYGPVSLNGQVGRDFSSLILSSPEWNSDGWAAN
jgi:hypothetical protein